MPFQPVLEPQPLLLVPPLLPPLVLRTESGFFGAPRGDIASFGDCPPYARFQEPPFSPPDDEGRPVRFVQARVHEALDLEGEAGDCVFVAYAGRVVEVEVGGGGTRGNVSIDHHPLGNGLVSRYLHLRGDSLCVEPGDPVAKGQLIGQLGPGPADPHLHFGSGSCSTAPTATSRATATRSPWTRRACSTGSRPTPCRCSRPGPQL